MGREDAPVVRHVALEQQHAVALQCEQALARAFERALVDIEEHERHTRRSRADGLGEAATDAAASASDEHDAVGEREGAAARARVHEQERE